MKKLEDYIKVFDGVLTNELCDSLLKEFSGEDEWSKTVIVNGDVNDKVRAAETIILSYPHVIERNQEIRSAIDKQLFTSAAAVIKQYNENFSNCCIQEDSGYELLRYKEGQFYVQHTDSFRERPRAVSCSFAINDDYEGGEWGFWDREKVVKLKKGSAILFPSNFMYPHEIMPVTKGVRHSVVTWFI